MFLNFVTIILCLFYLFRQFPNRVLPFRSLFCKCYKNVSVVRLDSLLALFNIGYEIPMIQSYANLISLNTTIVTRTLTSSYVVNVSLQHFQERSGNQRFSEVFKVKEKEHWGKIRSVINMLEVNNKDTRTPLLTYSRIFLVFFFVNLNMELPTGLRLQTEYFA